jgi:prolyl-tRNA synthetase
MRQSQLFYKSQKQAPKDEKAINAQLLIRAGFVDKLMAGVYSFLPLGFRVLKKIENIIREEMERIGAQELFLPALHPKNIWEKTKRWQIKEMFKLKNRKNKDFSLGWTHEEIITPLVKKIVSLKNLPIALFQIQTKFRDELRVKSGLLRAVEFLMKDLYSFHKTEKDLENYYQKVKKAYFKIFKRCGIGERTFLTLASGGTFSKYSHEFQTITPYGEDTIYLCQNCKLAVNKEIIAKEKYQCPECQNKNLEIKKSIEVGNIFNLKDKFSKPFEFYFEERGIKKPVLMGCYGIGLGRLMGTIVEIFHDKKGIVWPKEVAPFKVHLLTIESQKPKIKNEAEKIYHTLQKANVEVLYDDRENKTPGEKLVEADLIGIPYRIVISERTLKRNCAEVKKRDKKKVKLVKIESLLQFLNDQ